MEYVYWLIPKELFVFNGSDVDCNNRRNWMQPSKIQILESQTVSIAEDLKEGQTKLAGKCLAFGPSHSVCVVCNPDNGKKNIPPKLL
jgi:hypothetical protein